MLNLLARTWRFRINNKPGDFNSIVAFWHGKMLPVWYYFKNFNPLGIVSLSKDGEILSLLLKNWNYRLVRGSSSKGGKEVIDKTINENHNGPVLITPDGPRGPKEEMKAGAIIISLKSKKPLILCGVNISQKIRLKKSWDNFEIPLPFSKIYLFFSEKIVFDNPMAKEEVNLLRNDLSIRLKQLSK